MPLEQVNDENATLPNMQNNYSLPHFRRFRLCGRSYWLWIASGGVFFILPGISEIYPPTYSPSIHFLWLYHRPGTSLRSNGVGLIPGWFSDSDRASLSLRANMSFKLFGLSWLILLEKWFARQSEIARCSTPSAFSLCVFFSPTRYNRN